MGRMVNRSELAETFGVALSTVDLWVSQRMPCVSRPERRGGTGYQIDLSAVLEWHRERERQNALGEIAKVDEQEARRRKLAAEASLAELELQVKQGLVAPIAEAEKAWAAMVAACRAKLLSLGNKLGPVLASIPEAAECQSTIDTAVHEGLSELSGFEYVIASDPEPEQPAEPQISDRASSTDLGAPAAPHRKPVGGRKTKAKPRSKR